MPDAVILTDRDWDNIVIYVSSLKTLSDASKILEGQKYPTALSVIPYLDQIMTDLAKLVARLPQQSKAYPKFSSAKSVQSQKVPKWVEGIKPSLQLDLFRP